MSYEAMQQSCERYKNAQHNPAVFGFEGETLKELRHCLKEAGEGGTLMVRRGLNDDGSPCAWLHVRDAKGGTVGAMDYSFTCPPRPPEACDL